MNEKDRGFQSDPMKEIFIMFFMSQGFFSSEPDRLVTRAGAEALYEEMQSSGRINLNREDILRISQKFGEGFFESANTAPYN